MLSKEIIEKIKNIEIHTKRVLSGSTAGDYRTKSRGFGFDFDQIREYIQGDDIRFIDWKSSARTGKTLVRQYLEDKNRSIFIMLDVSGSVYYADKKELMATVSAAIALTGFYNKDNIGLILFSDKIVKFIPARATRQHIFKIIDEIFTFNKQSGSTNISQAIKEVMPRLKNSSIIFLISDFWDLKFNSSLKIFSRYHDLIAVSCYKSLEKNLPTLGVITFQDLESQEKRFLNLRGTYKTRANNFLKDFREDFTKGCSINSIDLLEIKNDKEIVDMLVKLSQKRVLK